MPRRLRIRFPGGRQLNADPAVYLMGARDVAFATGGSGPPPSADFVPEAGFQASGVFADGETFTITRAAGGLGVKPIAAPMYLWDSREGSLSASVLSRRPISLTGSPKSIDTVVGCNGRVSLRADLTPGPGSSRRVSGGPAFAFPNMSLDGGTPSLMTFFCRVRRNWDGADAYSQYLLQGYVGARARGDFNSANSYSVGDLVVFQGKVFDARVNMTAPSPAPTNFTSQDANWRLSNVREWNIKDWRMWGNYSKSLGAGDTNLHYSYGQSEAAAGRPRFTVERPPQGTLYPGGPGLAFSKNQWGTHFVQVRQSSALGATDAFMKVMVNDAFVERTGFSSYDSGNPYPWTDVSSVQYQFLYFNDPFFDWWDVWYADDSACAVLLTDGPWGAAGTKYEICIPTEWIDNRVRFSPRSGEWPDLAGKSLWFILGDGTRLLVGGGA